MSKVYILYKEDIFSIEESVNVVAVFSSYSAMLLWLKEQWSFESDVEDQDELNILRQFVQGKLDRDYILETVGDKLGLSKDEKHTCKLPKRDRKVSMTEIRTENF